MMASVCPLLAKGRMTVILEQILGTKVRPWNLRNLSLLPNYRSGPVSASISVALAPSGKLLISHPYRTRWSLKSSPDSKNQKRSYGFMISCSNTWSSSAVGHVVTSHLAGGSVADHIHWLIVQLCRSHLVRQSDSRKFLPSNQSSLGLSTLPVKQDCSST